MSARDPATVSGAESGGRRETLLARLGPLAAAIAPGAAQRDLDRVAPHEAFRLFRESGLGTLRLPEKWGGAGGSVRDVMDVISTLASADPNVAHALRAHFNFVELVGMFPDGPPLREAGLIADGGIFGSASTERGTARAGDVTTSLARNGDTYTLNGRKYYATGTAYADWVNIRALDETGASVRVVLPVSRAGIEVLDDWDGMGQRLTASGGIVFDNVTVYPGEIVQRLSDSVATRYASTFRQLFLSACQAGILRNVLADALDYVRHRARPIAHGRAATAGDDPYVQQAVGEIATASYAVDTLLAAAADTIDVTHAGILRKDAGIDGILADNAAATAKAQLLIARLSLQAAEKIFDVGGGSATSRELNFDRHWRNIRTLASHNPWPYKVEFIGARLLNDALPPAEGGYF